MLCLRLAAMARSINWTAWHHVTCVLIGTSRKHMSSRALWTMLEYELVDTNWGIQKVGVEPATRSAVATWHNKNLSSKLLSFLSSLYNRSLSCHTDTEDNENNWKKVERFRADLLSWCQLQALYKCCTNSTGHAGSHFLATQWSEAAMSCDATETFQKHFRLKQLRPAPIFWPNIP